MADLEGNWVPDDDDELQYITALSALAADAYDAGVDGQTLVAGLTYMATHIATTDLDADDDLNPADQPAKQTTCPDCDTDIDDVVVMMGGTAEVLPCGCQFDYEELPGWVDTDLDTDGGDYA